MPHGAPACEVAVQSRAALYVRDPGALERPLAITPPAPSRQVEFYKAKFTEWEAKAADWKDKYLREKKACDSWMRKAADKDKEKDKDPPKAASAAAVAGPQGTAKAGGGLKRTASTRRSSKPTVKRAASLGKKKKSTVEAESEPSTPGSSSAGTVPRLLGFESGTARQ